MVKGIITDFPDSFALLLGNTAKSISTDTFSDLKK